MIRLAIIGTGGMANAHAKAFQGIKGCTLVAACDVYSDRVEPFARKYRIPEVYTDVDDLLESSEIDAVANVTPDAFHASISLKVIAKGKHILCEKPLATNYPDAKKMAEAARRKGVINMVNFSYRNSSAIQRAYQLIQSGEIGRIRHVEASYLQGWIASKSWGDWRKSPAMLWRLSKKHGSQGTLGDLGVHIIDFATFPAGDIKSLECRLKTFPKPGGGRIGEYVFDANDSAVIAVELKNGAIGTIHTTRWAVGHVNSIKLGIYGEVGGLEIDLDRSIDTLRICRGKDMRKSVWKTVKCGKTPTVFQRFIKSIRTGRNDQPDFARGAAVQRILDACFESDKEGRAVTV
jgi:predicted dehydrogenase